jgi:hypothetical protein
MRIENSFHVPIPPAQAWPLLTDVAGVARCLPGAKLTASGDDGSYRGELGMQLGPVQMCFLGQMRFTTLDQAGGRATAVASAREARNRGSADATIDFTLIAHDQGTRVDIVTELSLAGQAAQYGRGAAVLRRVSQYLIDRFAQCLRKRVEAGA